MVVQRDLIFDLGMFEGQDAQFYMSKGFRVVSLEANPSLCEQNAAKYSKEIADGRLTIVPKALWHQADKRIPFYIFSAWSSIYPESAARKNDPITEVQVDTTTLSILFQTYGIPYYLKCDLEGADQILAAQLSGERCKPDFVSVEDGSGTLARKLAAAGYDRFQFVNQGRLHLIRPPNPAREGQFMDVYFDGTLSGLFGQELDPRHWVDLETCERRFQFWLAMREKRVNAVLEYLCRRVGKLTGRGWLVRTGWVDIHATRSEILAPLGVLHDTAGIPSA
jgi:FkbM family methyltransferase